MLFIGGMVVNFGMESFLIREVAKDKRRAEDLYPNAVFLATVFGLCSWAILIGLAYILHYDSEVVFLMESGGIILVCVGIGQIAAALIKAHEDMGTYAGITACSLPPGIHIQRIGPVYLEISGTTCGRSLPDGVTEGYSIGGHSQEISRLFSVGELVFPSPVTF